MNLNHPGTGAMPPRRPAILTVLVGLMAVGTTKPVWTVAFDRPKLDRAFPGLTPGLLAAYLATLVGI